MTGGDEPTGLMPPAAGPPGGAQDPNGGSNRAVPWLIGTGVVVVVALVAGFVILSGDDEAAAAEVFLEPATSIGEDPFTDSVAEGSGPVVPEDAADAADENPPASAVQATSAATPGLYGGTRDAASCNRRQLVEFLQVNREKGAAWAGVLGIQVGEIETYVQELTPVTLINDVRVTNHGYSSGRATVIQSVLQSGTAVLVDKFGTPRVRCSCGNPLKPPVAVGKPVYTGPRWQWWNPGHVTVISTTTVIIDTFVLTDIPSGTIFTRPAGTDGTDDGDAAGVGSTTTTSSPTSAPTTAAPSTSSPTVAPVSPPTEPPPSVTEADIIDIYFSVRDGDCATASYPNFEPHISESQSAVPRGDGTWDLRVVGTTESGIQEFTWIVDPVTRSFTPTNALASESAARCAAWG